MDVLWKILGEIAQSLAKWAARPLLYIVARKKALSISCLLCLTLGIVLLAWYYERLTEYSEIVSDTLNQELEPTPQRFKGIESFLLSHVDKGIRDDLANSPLDKEFVLKYDQISRAIQRITQVHPAAIHFQGNLKLRAWKHAERVISVHDPSSPGFLFLPRSSIREASGIWSQTNVDQIEKSANDRIVEDPQLARDILLTRVLINNIKDIFNTEPVRPLGKARSLDISHPVQLYIVTSTGVNKIYTSNVDESQLVSFYEKQFSPDTWFPSRPYFLGAVALPYAPLGLIEGGNNFDTLTSDRVKLSNYFYVSQPYIDLAGNGFVITLARKLLTYKNDDAVLCIDIGFGQSNSLTDTVSKTLERFKSPRYIGRLTISTANNAIASLVPPPGTPDEDKLIKDLTTYLDPKKHPADFFGSIQTINEPGAEPLEVSIPFGFVDSSSGKQTGNFMIFGLDFGRFRRQSQVTGIGGCVLIGAGILLLISGIVYSAQKTQAHAVALEELKTAFRRVGRVMRSAPIPYVLLSSDDKIQDCNKAMSILTGRTAEELKGMTFFEQIAKSDHLIYRSVQEQRAQGKPVHPYQLSFRKKNGAEEKKWVASSAVPIVEVGAASTFPETFGVLLDEEPQID